MEVRRSMSLTPKNFKEFFETLYGKNPFPWQCRLVEELHDEKWPDCIDLPTASGKTSVIDVLVYTLATQAIRPVQDRTTGRRIFFTVNRRVIVDEAYQRSIDLAYALKVAQNGIVKEVADALRTIGGDLDLPLDVAVLRGGVYCDAMWIRNLVQPTIVCTTADQFGSRLLFRGYGVSPGMQPIHAAACACDSVVLLDEAHVTKGLAQTLRLVQKYQGFQPGLRFVELTATPSQPPKTPFKLNDKDLEHPILSDRLTASKPATLRCVANKSLASEIAKNAIVAVNEERKAIGIIVNRIQTARDVFDLLSKTHSKSVHLVIGRMRPLDRDDMQKELRGVVGPERPEVLREPVFIVATQCLEVGADYDFDALITECASIDALRQRFGRLNRKGRSLSVYGSVITTEGALKTDDPVYGPALKETWSWLTESDRTEFDFGVLAFTKYWDLLDQDRKDKLVNTAPNAAVLLPVHLDALCQTNPSPLPTPDVSLFIHGPNRDNAEVNVCWRADLGDNPSHWPSIIGMVPPSVLECMTVPLRSLRRWMRFEDQPVDADVAVDVEEIARDAARKRRPVICWRGVDDAIVTDNPSLIFPGDTVVIPAPDESSLVLGHIPKKNEEIAYDLAEEAAAKSRLQRIVRIHPAVHSELFSRFTGYFAANDSISKPEIREMLGGLAEGMTKGPEEVFYPDARGVLLRFNQPLPKQDWKQQSGFVDDGSDSTTDSTKSVLLKQHLQDVVDCAKKTVEKLECNQLANPLLTAAALHDIGKADLRFTAMLAGVTPYEVLGRPALAKSGENWITRKERIERQNRAMLPVGFRHEAVSVQWVEQHTDLLDQISPEHRELVLHLIASHHGYARPFFPVCLDEPSDTELLTIAWDRGIVNPQMRQSWIPSHRVDSLVAERFWKQVRTHGWWGIAYIESLLRLADQQASSETLNRSRASE
jgi:CRISPR-associated endonuclease/helicase Cas3